MKWFVCVCLVLLATTPVFGGKMKNDSMQVYVYCYNMDGSPEAIGAAIPEHIEYWNAKGLEGYQGGPFADRSGGMIIFEAHDEATAKRLVAGDPFVVQAVVGDSWLKQWMRK